MQVKQKAVNGFKVSTSIKSGRDLGAVTFQDCCWFNDNPNCLRQYFTSTCDTLGSYSCTTPPWHPIFPNHSGACFSQD